MYVTCKPILVMYALIIFIAYATLINKDYYSYRHVQIFSQLKDVTHRSWVI